jgi:hypothetical protein
MDELDMIERFIALGREISEIRAANRVYWTRTVHNSLEQQLHQRRLERLKEIKKYFFLWFGTRLPKTTEVKADRARPLAILSGLPRPPHTGSTLSQSKSA